MRKFLSAILLFFLLSFPVLAQSSEGPPFSSPYDLISYWDTNGYPSNVGKPYFDTQSNKVAIPLVWGDSGEILPLLTDPDSVIFPDGEYTYRDLQQVADEINAMYRSEEYGITAVSIGWGSSGGFGENGKESRVLVTIRMKNYAMTAALLAGRYGGCVAFESEQGIPYSALQNLNTQQAILERENAIVYLLALSILIPCGTLCCFFLYLMKNKKGEDLSIWKKKK